MKPLAKFNYYAPCFLVPVVALTVILVSFMFGNYNVSEAHADSQGYQSDQLMRRLVKAEEDQARALQAVVRYLERMR